jgi:hypothetical protein
MKRGMLQLVVLAAAVPGLAFAGEPVPMSDSDLDHTVAAGVAPGLVQINAAIRAHPEQFRLLAARNVELFVKNEALVRKLLDDDLEPLLPQPTPRR